MSELNKLNKIEEINIIDELERKR